MIFEKALDNPKEILSDAVAGLIPFRFQQIIQTPKRQVYTYLHKISTPDEAVFDLSFEQATFLFVEEERETLSIIRKDEEYLS